MAIEEGRPNKPRVPDLTPAERSASNRANQNKLKQTFATFGEGYKPAAEFVNTEQRIRSVINDQLTRENEPPLNVAQHECRIGLSRFFVPPININVQQTFKTGSLTGTAIRQQNSPKFNSGHTETVIEMTLYFPNYEQIWGYENQVFEIDFDKDDPEKIDLFLSSFRGLLAQFKYAPFLPIRNDYLNRTFGITGVVMQSMSVSTVDEFPFALAVNLTMLKFNHKVYMPMIKHFDQAIHWGRFRQYMGRAVHRLRQTAGPIAKPFNPAKNQVNNSTTDIGELDFPYKTADEVLSEIDTKPVSGKQAYGRYTWKDAKGIDFFYPFHTPARINLPELDNLRDYNVNTKQRDGSLWQNLLKNVGISVNTYPEAKYEKILSMANERGFVKDQGDEYKLLTSWLNRLNLTVEIMGPGRLEEYIERRAAELKIKAGTGAYDELRYQLQKIWFLVMYKFMREDPHLARFLGQQDKYNRELTIREWDVPMVKLGLNPDTVLVRGISVTVGNTIVPLQLQLQDEPTHQHIGGQDARIDISLILTGPDSENELVKIRQMFESISGLARIQHGHGMLGFLGMKNIITSLVGIKYAVPMSFEVDTIPNQPHSYEVRITLTDFDVFQQKREMLTSEQQATLINAFSKANPFLRLKQMWGAFNAYPDFPLSVRNDKGAIVGHLDPDYYFRFFKTIDDDTVEWTAQDGGGPERAKKKGKRNKDKIAQEEGARIVVGEGEEGLPGVIVANRNGITVADGNNVVVSNGRFDEPTAANQNRRPVVPDTTPPSGYANPYAAGSDPSAQFAFMMQDFQYRDKSGRMIRAFPTYMLWLIDEGGNFAGIKMFDNFYGLQSVLDFSIVQSEDILGDTLQIRLSNLYSRLSTPYGEMINEDIYTKSRVINTQVRRQHRILTGLADYLSTLDTIELKPGVRLHLRAGYGGNPNMLDTVFNGVVTEVQAGDIITVTAQSDAIELSAYVNTTDKKGHSGKIDGDMVGMYLSEPRDLMIKLLTEGSSMAKEAIAHATKGAVFSESRFGIRHFGVMLRSPLSEDEVEKSQKIRDRVDAQANTRAAAANDTTAEEYDSTIASFEREGFADIVQTLWSNMAAKRDYEIFKRNIYPGNGLGIAQFMGGDIGDVGLTVAIDGTKTVTGATGVSPDGSTAGLTDLGIASESTNERGGARGQRDTLGQGNNPEVNGVIEGAPLWATALTAAGAVNPVLGAAGLVGGVMFGTAQGHRMREMLGLINETDDDGAFDEVSFRAQTHMKTVWDLFKTCAALLPDYIVAVRPFEDRSTVFYGKPHWLYTSGVIPLSTGVKASELPPMVEPDEEWADIFKLVEENLMKGDDVDAYNTFKETLAQVSPVNIDSSNDPDVSAVGSYWSEGEKKLLEQPTEFKGKKLPYTEGFIVREMHLPTSDDYKTDKEQHLQLDELPAEYRHPFYMDRLDPGNALRGGYVGSNTYDPGKGEQQAILKGEEKYWNRPGKPGSMGVLDPVREQWYMNQLWSANGHNIHDFKDAKVLIYNKKKNKGVVCAPSETGPAAGQKYIAGCSPDVFLALGNPYNDKVFFRVMPNSTPLGPVKFGAAPTSRQTERTPDTQRGVDLNLGSDATGTKPDRKLPRGVGLDLGSDDKGVTEADLDAALEPEWAKGKLGSLTLEQYAFAEGWKKTDPPIPVNYTTPKEGKRGESGFVPAIVDDIGKDAEQFFVNRWSDPVERKQNANQIWQEFRELFALNPDTKETYKRATAKLIKKQTGKNASESENVAPPEVTGDDFPSWVDADLRASLEAVLNEGHTIVITETGTVEIYHKGETPGETGTLIAEYPPPANWKKPADFVPTSWDKGTYDPQQNRFRPAPELDPDAENAAINDFMMFMWQHPWTRGWLVNVTDAQVKAMGINEKVSENIEGASDDSPAQFAMDVFTNVADFLGGWRPEGGYWDNDVIWDLHKARLAFAAYIFYKGQGKHRKFKEWLANNNQQGRDSNDALDAWMDESKSIFARVFKAIGAFASGALSFVRMSMMQISNGMSMASQMQKQTNQLNRTFNDSIYYSAGRDASGAITNPLLYYADNPFTREYGEPVVEIRQPFQRIHTIGSFGHILNNGIIENIAGVATVVSATSNGQFPVTVHFDKSAPAEKQMETAIDTGLFIDHPKGWFGIKKLLNPVETARYWMQSTGAGPSNDGVSAETSAKRIALAHLKENLKDIYQGELTILGDASIRPHDLVYLADVYERMYGFFEVEQVVHHFTPDQGFITSITPNAIVTINDPARFSIQSYWRTQMMMQSTRNHLREAFGVNYSNERDLQGADGAPLKFQGQDMTVGEVAKMIEPQIMNSMQYTGGASALTKSVASMIYGGGLTAGTTPEANDGEPSALSALNPVNVALNPLGSVIKFGAWKAWGWVRDNLLDQAGCYIEYLTHNGQPMDANLSGNENVAVGSQRAINLTLGGLRMGGIKVLGPDDSPVIRTQDVIKQLQWDEYGPNDAAAAVDMFVDQTNAAVRQIRTADGYPFIKNEVYWAKITHVVDGDTFSLTVSGHIGKDGQFQSGSGGFPSNDKGKSGTTSFRLAQVGAPEISNWWKNHPELWNAALDSTGVLDIPEGKLGENALERNLAGIRAAVFARDKLLNKGVALRIVPTERREMYGRTMGYVFVNSPGLTGKARKDYLLGAAGGWPEISWDSYDDAGQPYSFNWDLVAAGHADVYTKDFDYNLPGRGVEGG